MKKSRPYVWKTFSHVYSLYVLLLLVLYDGFYIVFFYFVIVFIYFFTFRLWSSINISVQEHSNTSVLSRWTLYETFKTLDSAPHHFKSCSWERKFKRSFKWKNSIEDFNLFFNYFCDKCPSGHSPGMHNSSWKNRVEIKWYWRENSTEKQ